MSKKLYQTSDGTKFYHEQDAKNHALSLEDRKVDQVDSNQLTVDSKKETGNGEQGTEKSKTDKKSAVELIAEIEQVETLEQLDAYEVHKQVTVKTAVEKRRSELTVDIEVDLGDGTGNGEQGTGNGEEDHGLQIRDSIKEDKGE